MFSVHTTLEKFKNATISGFVFEENSTGKSSDYRNDLLTYSDWPTDRPTARLTHQPTDRPTDRQTDRQPDWPTNRLTDRLTDQPTDWPTDPPTDWLTDVRLTDSLVDLLTDLLTYRWSIGPRQPLESELKFGLFVLLLSSCFISTSVLHHCPVASCFWGVPLSLPLRGFNLRACQVMLFGDQSSPISFSKSVHLPVVAALFLFANFLGPPNVTYASQATIYESLDLLEYLSCPSPRLRSIEEN